MELVVLGLLFGVVLGVRRGRRARRRAVVLAPAVVGADRDGLPSRLRDPETGEVL